MNITSTNATQPNFTARIKNNDYIRNYYNKSSKSEKKAMQKATEKLSHVYPDDVLEITCEKVKGESKYVVRNQSKKTETLFDTSHEFINYNMDHDELDIHHVTLSSVIKAVADPWNDDHKKVFAVGEKQDESKQSKADKEFFDMLA